MSSRFVKFTVLLLIVAIVSYIFYLNPSTIEVVYKPGTGFRAPLALILIFSFFFGALVMSLIGLIIGIGFKIKINQVSKREKQLKKHQSLITEARENLAVGDYKSAQSLFRKVIDKDPDDITARVLLSESFRKNTDQKTALAVLDEARIEQKKNVEVLLLASKLNAELGNNTAAYDNAAMALKLKPKSPSALKQLVDGSRMLGRYDDSIEFQQQLIKLTPSQNQKEEYKLLSELELESAISSLNDNPSQLRSTLKQIIRRNQDFAKAYLKLAKLEESEKNYEIACTLWADAYRIDRDPAQLHKITTTWMDQDQPSKAIDYVKKAVMNNKEQDGIGLIFLVSLLLRLDHLEEARKIFNTILINEIKEPKIKNIYSLIKARFHQKDGELDKAFAEILSTIEISSNISREAIYGAKDDIISPLLASSRNSEKTREKKSLEAPSPRLSTP